MQNSITITSEIVDAYDNDGAVCLIVEPPKELQPQQWREWVEDFIVLPVEDVEPITESGRQLAKIIVGDWWTKDNNPPKVFHLAPPEQIPTVSIYLGPSESTRRYTPTVTATGSLTQAHATSVDLPRATKPVRVHPATHRRLKAYAAQTGQEIAVIIGAAVDKYLA